MNFQVPNSCAKRLERWRHIRKPYKTPGRHGPEVQAVDFYGVLPENLLASYADQKVDPGSYKETI
jgi:hypothetical protein